MIDNRTAALRVLERAGVIAPAGFNDANGNPAYRMLKFPDGVEGERLRRLFNLHIKGRESNRLDGAALSR